MPTHDSAPIIGYFRDIDTADQCLRELRQSGILNEQIGVSYAGSTVHSPANDPGVQRATDQANSASEIFRAVHDEPGNSRQAPLATPTGGRFDSEGEAREFLHPAEGVMVSVSIDPIRREEIRDLLQHYGARLSDWPASQDKVA